MSNSSSEASFFGPLQSIFIELVTRNQYLYEKVYHLEKQFYQQHQTHVKELNDTNDRLNIYINQHNDQLDKDHIQMNELLSKNQQLNKQIDEQIIRCNELENDTGSYKEQIKRFEQNRQQESQVHIKELNHTNDYSTDCIVQLNDQLKNHEIQIKRIEDNNIQLKDHINQLLKQNQAQHLLYTKNMEDSNRHINICQNNNDDQLKEDHIQIIELQNKHQQLQKQFDEYISQFYEIQTKNHHNLEQTNQLSQQRPQENQTQTTELENINRRINTVSILLNDLLNNNEIEMKKFVDENQKLKQDINNLEKQYQIQMKEFLDISNRGNTYSSAHNNQIDIDQIKIQEFPSKNEQLKKQVDDQIIQFNEFRNNNRFLEEQINTLGEQHQQETRTHLREFKDTNHRLDQSITQLNDRLTNDEVQLERFEDEKEQLKKRINQLEKQMQKQNQIHITEQKNINDHSNLYYMPLNDQSEQNDDALVEIDQFKNQIIEEKIHLHKLENDHQTEELTKCNEQHNHRRMSKINQYHNIKLQRIIQQQESHSSVNLDKHKLADHDMEIVIKEAIVNKQCTQLSLSSNKITSVGVSILAEALNNNKTLEELHLHDNEFFDGGIYSLVKALSNNNSNLKALYLGKNGITDEGAKHLTRLIKTNAILTSLSLSENEITDSGIRLLANAIENHNKTIEVLDLSSNKLLTDSSIDALLQMIKYNQSLKNFYVLDCNLSEKGKERLQKAQQLKNNFDVWM